MGITLKRSSIFGTTVIATTIAILAAESSYISQSWAQVQPELDSKGEASPKALSDQVWQRVNSSYVDGSFNGIDWRTVRNQYLDREYGTQEDAYIAIGEMLKKLNDPYTRFIDPQEFKALQTGSFGVGLTLAQDEKTKKIVVISPLETSPASTAGILPQDVLVNINGQSTQRMNVNEAVGLLRGPVNTQVTLTVLRNNKPLEFKLTRTPIKLRPVGYSYRQSPIGGIGYIRLIQFSSTAEVEMREAIQNLERRQVAGYILDLRFNSGGLFNASTEIARMWLEKGLVVSTVNRQGKEEITSTNTKALTNKPLVILIDEGTASGSEILAVALQENQRAILVGTKTKGYNSIQSVRPLPGGSGLAVTISKWFTPKGRDINNLGLTPSVVISLTEAQRLAMISKPTTIGTSADLQYTKALDTLVQLIQKNSG